MTIQYKNSQFSLTSTTLTTVLTIDNKSRAIIKNIQTANVSTATTTVTTKLFDNSLTTNYIIGRNVLSSVSTTNIVQGNSLILEESDALKMSCTNTQVVSGSIAYALINRTNENG